MNMVPVAVHKELAAPTAKLEYEIELSNLPATSAKDLKGASKGQFYRPLKQQLTVRIDADVLAWLKA